MRGSAPCSTPRRATRAAPPTTICSCLAAEQRLPPRGSTRCWSWSAWSRVADDRVGGFSLGMGQRLGIAAALLGDPEVLMLDEPVNGLDPEGIRWIRELLRGLADEGRTVFVSSHLMSEMAHTADHLVVIGRGRLLADVPMEELLGAHSAVRVRTPQGPMLADALRRAGRPGRARDRRGAARGGARPRPRSATRRSSPTCGCTSSAG